MKIPSKIIDEFNTQFSENASLCVDMRVGWDLDGCSEYTLYKLLEDQRKASFGEVLYRRIGSYCIGPYYEEKGIAGFNHAPNSNSIERFYPISSNEVCSRLEIGYKSYRLGGKRDYSTDNFRRWWTDSFESLLVDFPEQAKKVEQLLMREIESLANTARTKGLKSGWVYYRFQDKLEYLTKRINLDFLISTTYFFEPTLFYNQFSHKLVSLNEQENRELKAKIHNEQFLNDSFQRW